MTENQITAIIICSALLVGILIIGFFSCVGHCAGCNCYQHEKEREKGYE